MARQRNPLPLSYRRALREYTHAVRLHEMRGTYTPAEAQELVQQYRSARRALEDAARSLLSGSGQLEA
jgi:hypothetical protein